MANKITVVGSSNTDMIIKMDHIPAPGETILGGKFNTAAGGKGANQAVAAARAGAHVTFIARIGDDMFGQKAKEGFIKDNIDVSHIITDSKHPSGVALIFVGEDGENSIAVASGANAQLSPDDVALAADAIKQADIVVMQLETPIETIEAAATIASENGVKVILNPAPARALSDALLSKVDILTPNETEAQLLTGVFIETNEDAEKAAQILNDKGVKTVIFTLGSKGAFVVSPQFKGLIEGFKVEPVDTTAAGDTFNGALAVALSQGKDLKASVRFANAAAALSVTKLGAQPSAPNKEDIEKFLKA